MNWMIQWLACSAFLICVLDLALAIPTGEEAKAKAGEEGRRGEA